MPIDLRSDFLTRPTPAMLEAGARAAHELQFGLREDPRQRALEARIAQLLGCEDALVFPTCTMANLAASLLLGRRGTRAVMQRDAHVLTSEAGGLAAIAGLIADPLPGEAAMPGLEAWRRAAGIGDEQKPPASLFVLENTHNRAGGVPVSSEYTRAVVAIAREHGLRVHLDGSRIFNAATALGASPAELAAGFDTVAISLNKAVGAPIAAALAGSTARVAEALIVRQRLGGGIRPTGPAAAATLAALEELGHFRETHALAARLAAALSGVPGVRVDEPAVRTNIVVAELAGTLTAPRLCAALAAHGLLALPFDDHRLRFITYRGVTAADIDAAIAIVARVMGELSA